MTQSSAPPHGKEESRSPSWRQLRTAREAIGPETHPRDETEATKRFIVADLRNSSKETHWLQATLTVLRGPKPGTVYPLRRGTSVIGRSTQADIQINAEGVSRRHAEIKFTDGVYYLHDLGSTNGTACDGEWLDQPVKLKEGSRVNLGCDLVLRFALEGELEQKLRARLYELTTKDPLTMAYNRRFLEERMSSEWPWAVRHNQACALLIFDLDHFKQVNDTWGHLAGDYVLKELVTIVAQTIRREDLLARVGGEEFAVLCRSTELTRALILAERLRTRVARHEFVWHGERIHVTLSLGVATTGEPEVTSTERLSTLADERLYSAKSKGRNRVEPPGC
ncbi:diguanylate cyclase [Myxococcota bacterium]